MAPPVVTNASQLPGALLFLTYTPKGNGRKYSGVAYDPYAQSGDTLTALTERYNTGKDPGTFPYFQLFTEIKSNEDNVAKWDKNGDTFLGTFGQLKDRNSEPWPYANVDGCPIKNGVIISFWNKGGTTKGCETMGIGQVFDDTAKTTYMALNKGHSHDLLAAAKLKSKYFDTITLEYYAMVSGRTLNLKAT